MPAMIAGTKWLFATVPFFELVATKRKEIILRMVLSPPMAIKNKAIVGIVTPPSDTP